LPPALLRAGAHPLEYVPCPAHNKTLVLAAFHCAAGGSMDFRYRAE
jgi:hypothetical protein